MRQSLVVVTVTMSLFRPALGQDTETLPVPDESAQAQALAVVEEVYKGDYKAANSNDKKSALAGRMLQDAMATKGSAADRYVLLRVSKDIACQAGDVATAFAAIAEIEKTFEVDGLSMMAAALAEVSKALRLPKEHQALAPQFLLLIEQAVAVDRYDLAKDIGEAALRSARQARNSDVVKQLVALQKRTEQVEDEFNKVTAAVEVLKDKPSDPEANLVVGRFHCFAKSAWGAGIPLLALGSDQHLKALATMELAEKPDALAIGDGWWDLADKLGGEEQVASRADVDANSSLEYSRPTNFWNDEMSIRNRLEDARLLLAAGRREGAFIQVLIAAAATSKRRYPRDKWDDGEAFRNFIYDEMGVITGGPKHNVAFPFQGHDTPLEDITSATLGHVQAAVG